jgi:hypothetical protein
MVWIITHSVSTILVENLECYLILFYMVCIQCLDICFYIYLMFLNLPISNLYYIYCSGPFLLALLNIFLLKFMSLHTLVGTSFFPYLFIWLHYVLLICFIDFQTIIYLRARVDRTDIIIDIPTFWILKGRNNDVRMD